jgi:GNAT superfamily N-acetyltransferase
MNQLANIGEAHRGQGIGHLLMESIQQWAREHNISEIELQVWERNTSAIGFYKRFGYQNWRRTLRFKLDKTLDQ